VVDGKVIQNGDTPLLAHAPMSKVERRESTRLSSGASKFLRAFRTGTTKVENGGKCLNLDGPQNRISPNPKGPAEGTHPNSRHTPPREIQSPVSRNKHPTKSTEARVPERSLSFQNGGTSKPVTQKIASLPRGTSNNNNSRRGGKPSRPQSFLIPPSGSQEFSSTRNPKNVSVTPSTDTPRGHFYENLEVIRANLKGLTDGTHQGTFGASPVNHAYVNVPSHRKSHCAPPGNKEGEGRGKSQTVLQDDDGGFEKRKLRRSVSEVPPDRIQNQIEGRDVRASRQSMFGSSSVTSRNRNG